MTLRDDARTLCKATRSVQALGSGLASYHGATPAPADGTPRVPEEATPRPPQTRLRRQQLLQEDCVDIVVKGRNVEVPDHFRQKVQDKLQPSERLDSRVHRLDVELSHEKNPRQSDRCQRVEITCYSKGPVIRAEACAPDFYAALDAACLKLEARLRKSHDRRRVHHGGKSPASVAEATAGLSAPPASLAQPEVGEPQTAAQDDTESLVVRDKTHPAQAMSTTQALHEMELVGHDFFLFVDAVTGLPSVVYRRHGYDYGVIRVSADGAGRPAQQASGASAASAASGTSGASSNGSSGAASGRPATGSGTGTATERPGALPDGGAAVGAPAAPVGTASRAPAAVR